MIMKGNSNGNSSGKGKGKVKYKGKGKGKVKSKGNGNGKSPGPLCSCSLNDSCGCREDLDLYQEVSRFIGDISHINNDSYRHELPMSLKNNIPAIISDSHQDLRPLVMKNSMPTIERLYAPTTHTRGIYGSDAGLYPASYGGPIGPKCNWRKCSNKGGCGTECTCHPAGQYGWRCIPDCCIGTNGSPPCRYKYNAHVQCTLPCSTWPGLCQQNFFNPYHQYQGPLEYPKKYGPALSVSYG